MIIEIFLKVFHSRVLSKYTGSVFTWADGCVLSCFYWVCGSPCASQFVWFVLCFCGSVCSVRSQKLNHAEGENAALFIRTRISFRTDDFCVLTSQLFLISLNHMWKHCERMVFLLHKSLFFKMHVTVQKCVSSCIPNMRKVMRGMVSRDFNSLCLTVIRSDVSIYQIQIQNVLPFLLVCAHIGLFKVYSVN